VRELARLFQSFANCSALEGCALKAAMLMPILLLQKTQFKSRSKEDAWVLERRLKCWQRVIWTVYYRNVAQYNIIFPPQSLVQFHPLVNLQVALLS